MIYICKVCGKEIKDKPSHKRIYCSKECHDNAQSKQITLKCDYCCKEYKTSPSKTKWKHHFCCNKCRLFWLSIHVKNNVNIKGHSKGHKAQHLTDFNLACGSFKEKKGYIKRAGQLEHRAVMEQKLGRKLRQGEYVHHIDCNKQNNSPENLMVVSKSEHAKIHADLKIQSLKIKNEGN